MKQKIAVKAKFSCSKCDKPFGRKFSRNRHEENCRNKPNILICGTCSKICKTPSKLERHVKSHIPKTKYRCPGCRHEYIRKDKFNRHLQICTKVVDSDHSDDEQAAVLPNNLIMFSDYESDA